MDANPFAGVAYHWVGGLAAASFHIPYKAVKQWSWETVFSTLTLTASPPARVP